MRVFNNIGRCAAAAAFFAAALQTAHAEGYGISYTWVEGGASRVAPSINGKTVDMDGGYLRGSFALGDHFYLLGSYSQNTGKWKQSSSYTHSRVPVALWLGYTDADTTLTKNKGKLAQGELGFGFRLSIAERLDAVAELTGVHWEQEVKNHSSTTRSRQYDWAGFPLGGPSNIPVPDSRASAKDSTWGGKALVGLRAQPFDSLELWAKAGYLKLRDRGNKQLLDKSVLGNIGVQFRVTENFGVVGEADIYERDLNQYRVGARVSF